MKRTKRGFAVYTEFKDSYGKNIVLTNYAEKLLTNGSHAASEGAPVDSTPSKESLERAMAFNHHISIDDGDACFDCRRIALEFDAIARERNEAAEKLAEALRWALTEGTKGFYVVEDGETRFYHCKFCHAVDLSPTELNHEDECKLWHVKVALAAWRKREGR